MVKTKLIATGIVGFSVLGLASADEVDNTIKELKEKGYEVELIKDKIKVYSKEEFDKLTKAEQERIQKDVYKIKELVKANELKEAENKKVVEENTKVLEKWTSDNEKIKAENKKALDIYNQEKERLETEYNNKVVERDKKVSEIEDKFKKETLEYQKQKLSVDLENEKRKHEYDKKLKEYQDFNARQEEETSSYNAKKAKYESTEQTRDISVRNLIDVSNVREVEKEVDLGPLKKKAEIDAKIAELTEDLKTRMLEKANNYKTKSNEVVESPELNSKVNEIKTLLESVGSNLNVTKEEIAPAEFDTKKTEKLTELNNLKTKVADNSEYIKKNKEFYDFVKGQFNEDISTINGKKTLTTKSGKTVELEIINEEVDMTKDNNKETFDTPEARNILTSSDNTTTTDNSNKEAVDKATYDQKRTEFLSNQKVISRLEKHNQNVEANERGEAFEGSKYARYRTLTDLLDAINPSRQFGTEETVNKWNMEVLNKTEGVEYLNTYNLSYEKYGDKVPSFSSYTLSPFNNEYATPSPTPVFRKYMKIDYFTIKVPKGGSFTIAYSKKTGEPILGKDAFKSYTSFVKKTTNKGNYTVEEVEDLDKIVYTYTNRGSSNPDGSQIVHVMNDIMKPFINGTANTTFDVNKSTADTSRPPKMMNMNSDNMITDSYVTTEFMNKNNELLKPVTKYFDLEKTKDSIVDKGLSETNKGVYTYKSLSHEHYKQYTLYSKKVPVNTNNGLNSTFQWQSFLADENNTEYKNYRWDNPSVSMTADGSTGQYGIGDHAPNELRYNLREHRGFIKTFWLLGTTGLDDRLDIENVNPLPYKVKQDIPKVKVKKLTPKNVDVTIPKTKKNLGELEIEKLKVKYLEEYPVPRKNVDSPDEFKEEPKLELLKQPTPPMKEDLPVAPEKPSLPEKPTEVGELEKPKLKETTNVVKDKVKLSKHEYEFLNASSANTLTVRQNKVTKSSSGNSFILRFLKR